MFPSKPAGILPESCSLVGENGRGGEGRREGGEGGRERREGGREGGIGDRE